MVFNFNKFMSINENKSNLKIDDYVLLSNEDSDNNIPFDSPWNGCYGIIKKVPSYKNDPIYLVKILSKISEKLQIIIKSNIQDKVKQNYIKNDDELWIHSSYLNKYKSLEDVKTAAYIFNNKNDIDKYNL